MTWRLISDGQLIAGGDAVTSATKRDVTLYTLRRVTLVGTPRRESKLVLHVDDATPVEGHARCERWGSEFVFTGEKFRLEAGR